MIKLIIDLDKLKVTSTTKHTDKDDGDEFDTKILRREGIYQDPENEYNGKKLTVDQIIYRTDGNGNSVATVWPSHAQVRDLIEIYVYEGKFDPTKVPLDTADLFLGPNQDLPVQE